MLRDRRSFISLRGVWLAVGVFAVSASTVLITQPAAQQATMGELVDRAKLRVCADPANLPFSNEQGEGFENKIAELMADHMKVPVAYTWYPQTIGFVRNTLNARRCDLVMGVVSADELVQNTNPYYRSTYVLAHRTADGSKFADLSSPTMRRRGSVWLRRRRRSICWSSMACSGRSIPMRCPPTPASTIPVGR